jgi:hypothetical protein
VPQATKTTNRPKPDDRLALMTFSKKSVVIAGLPPRIRVARPGTCEVSSDGGEQLLEAVGISLTCAFRGVQKAYAFGADEVGFEERESVRRSLGERCVA